MRNLVNLLVLLLALPGIGAHGATETETIAQRTDRLKAGYLLNFVKFVEWPVSVPTSLLMVCFAGGQGVLDAFASGIENKSAGERHLAVRKLSDAEKPAGCNVVYLDAERMAGSAHASAMGEAPILTVSDAKAFAHSGGMIELFTESNKLRFNINVQNALRAGLHISASLLQLAATVEPATPP
jgi:hypothetical protein